MTDTELIAKQLLAAAELQDKATGIAWTVEENAWPPEKTVCDGECIVVVTATNKNSCDMEQQKRDQDNNLRLIAASRTIPLRQASAALEALRAENERLQLQVEAAQAEEREACANVCDARAATLNAALAGESCNDICVLGEAIAAEQLAAAIRARGKA